MIVVSDTSPITNLIKIGRLNLLKEVFQQVIIPDKVRDELLEWKKIGADITAFESAPWIETQTPADLSLVKGMLMYLDEGEAQAIVLAHELKADYLLIDERRGWKQANDMGIRAIGLVGVLLQAKSLRIIPAVMPIVDDLRNIAGFWLSQDLYDRIKQITKE